MLVIKHVFIVVLAGVGGALTDIESAFVWGIGGHCRCLMTLIFTKCNTILVKAKGSCADNSS
jgi:hypothetical protein